MTDPADRFAQAARDDERAALATVIAAPPAGPVALGARMLVLAGGARAGTLGDPELDAVAAAAAEERIWSERPGAVAHADARVFVDVTAPSPRLLIVGAIDLAAQLCAVARVAGWRPFVIDPRGRFAAAERFPAAERVLTSWPQEAFAELAPLDAATAVVVLSHDPKLDDVALALALDSAACFVGAMGSRRATADRRARLLAAGLDEERVARVSAPVGLDLGAAAAGQTAISIMSEVIAVRNGRAGARLSRTNGRIHVPEDDASQ